MRNLKNLFDQISEGIDNLVKQGNDALDEIIKTPIKEFETFKGAPTARNKALISFFAWGNIRDQLQRIQEESNRLKKINPQVLRWENITSEDIQQLLK